MLINAQQLQQRLAAGEAFALIDTRELSAWQQASLPGAFSLNVYDYFIADSTEQGIREMAGCAQAAWQQLNIGDNVTPVFFEQQIGMRAPRGAWFAWLLGREDALILDGGVDSWLAAGGSLQPGQAAQAVIQTGVGQPLTLTPQQRRWVASRQQVIDADGKQSLILDSRRPSEFDGSFVHDCCQRAGRIPGAHLLFWEDVVQQGQFLTADNIRARIPAGITSEQQIIIYCHRGARAATVLAALQLAGYQHLAIYVGSWHEWAEQTSLPLQSGPAIA